MSKILCIETSTTVCSVALAENGNLLGLEEIHGVNSHSTHLAVCIESLLQKCKSSFADISAVAVSEGPGSYTGLRIGVSTAKGICFGLDIPLIAIGTLESLMQMYILKNKTQEEKLYFPMIDAKRMEVYTQLFNSVGKNISNIYPLVIDSECFNHYLQQSGIVLFGEGATKCKEIFTQKEIEIEDNISISAEGLIKPAFEKFYKKEFVDLAYFEPYYLKEFVAGLPKIKGLK